MECGLFMIRSLTPLQAAGNALAFAVQSHPSGFGQCSVTAASMVGGRQARQGCWVRFRPRSLIAHGSLISPLPFSQAGQRVPWRSLQSDVLHVSKSFCFVTVDFVPVHYNPILRAEPNFRIDGSRITFCLLFVLECSMIAIINKGPSLIGGPVSF
jgi:hypothetical protein